MGNYVAKEDIPYGGVLAYTRGQRVDADAVKANGWDDQVVGEGTKEARAIHAEITGQPAEASDTKATSRASAKNTDQEG